jgi:hypothetical protein
LSIKRWNTKKLVSLFQNANTTLPRQTAPASVCCSHPATLDAGKQHRQAVGHHDGAGHTRLIGQAGIGCHGVWCGGIYGQHGSAMHLVQKHWQHTDGALKNLPIGRHMRRVVTHMVAQIQAVIGRN